MGGEGGRGGAAGQGAVGGRRQAGCGRGLMMRPRHDVPSVIWVVWNAGVRGGGGEEGTLGRVVVSGHVDRKDGAAGRHGAWLHA